MQHAHTPQHASTGYALTLFVLGAVTGLLSLLGRLGQELHYLLLSRLPQPGLGLLPRQHATLAPLLRDLDTLQARLILAGFALSTLILLAGAILWHSTGHPTTLRERIWMRFTSTISLSIWLAMLGASLITMAALRVAIIVISGGLALLGLFVFVYLLFEFQFTNSAPPLPDDEPSA
jgi:hypothetical protein